MEINFTKIKIVLAFIIFVLMIVIAFTYGSKKDVAYKNISSENAKKLIENNEVLLLDVRTEEEFNSGHLKNATLLPLNEVKAKAEITLYSTEEIILVYCRSGNRSEEASKILANLGYLNVYNLEGGIMNWNYEIVK